MQRVPFLVATAVVVLSLCSTQVPAQADEVEAVFETIIENFNNRDLKPFLSAWHREAVFYTANYYFPLALGDLDDDDWLQVWSDFFNDMDELTLDTTDMRYRVTGDVASAWGRALLRVKPKDGEPFSETVRLSVVFVKEAGSWKILSWHDSRPREPRERQLKPGVGSWQQTAPATFHVSVETSRGTFEMEVHREWAPIGADRFYNLVRSGYFDDSRFSRVREGFIVQFGIAGEPALSQSWRNQELIDDPVVESNMEGTFAYAMTGPDTRTTQIYINLANNSRLDQQGFAPVGRVSRGMEVVKSLYSGYDEQAGGGMRAGKQDSVFNGGNVWLDANFPSLDRLLTARIVQ